MQRFLPAPDLTVLLDIAPETATVRKAVGRDRYEADLALQSRVRESYWRQAELSGWLRVDGEQAAPDVAAAIAGAVDARLERP